MLRATVVLGLLTAPACKTPGAVVGTTLGVGFGVTGAALMVSDPGSDRATVGIITSAVGAYLLLAALGAELSTTERPRAIAATGDLEPADEGVPHARDDDDADADADVARDPVAFPGKRGARAYDRTGSYAGRIDTNGHLYDRTGSPAGRIDDDGHVYDRTGSPAGRIDDRGQVYDRTGSPAGRVDERGQFYDRTGSPAGRIDENGNIYDRTGSYAGRVDADCDEACRRTTAGTILLHR